MYKIIKLKKPNGGFRTLEEPDPVLKAAQSQLLHKLQFISCDFPEYVTGNFGPQAGTHNAAKFHTKHPAATKQIWVAGIDIENFFGHTTPAMVMKALIQHNHMTEIEAAAVANFCMTNEHLPQGAPCSSYLANVAALTLYKRLHGYAQYKEISFSAYVDDMYLSSPVKEKIKKLKQVPNSRTRP